MKNNKVLVVILISGLLLACSHRKKTQNTALQAAPPADTGTPVAGPSLVVHPENGVYLPTEKELAAIQVQYPNTPMDMLKQGYAVYTGACANCHEAKNVYPYTDSEWGSIMVDMAMRAHLKDNEKEAVWKFVMAVRATNTAHK